MNEKPLISIIIPTYNEERDIAQCIESLNNQTYKTFEIIVVDDGSTDKTKDIIKKFKKIKLIWGAHKGPGFSRNIGAKKASGKILIFIDSDMEFEGNYLKNLIKPLINNVKIIGTTHEQEIVKNTNNIWSRCWGKIRVSKKEAKNVKIFRAIKKEQFIKFGGFDPKYGYADDQTFWFKYKVKPVVAKDTICYHKNPETLKAVYKQSRWIGASIDNKVLNMPIIKYIIPLLLILISPITIPLLAVNKAYKINELKILFPWIIIFMAARYFGSISGVSRNIYLGINYR